MYPYTLAFTAFSRGTPVEEIAANFKIPLKSLRAKIRQDGWRALAIKLGVSAPPAPPRTSDAFEKCEYNRAKNYEAAAELRDSLVGVIAHLRAGTLKVRRQWNHNGKIVSYDAEPTVTDMLNIARYAATVTDLTYRALGDHAASGGYKPASPSAEVPAPPFTIVLPSVIAYPRDKREGTGDP